MTDAITLIDFVGTFEAKTRSIDMPDCHPSAASNIHWWLAEMRDAACHDEAGTVAQLTKRITDTVAQERRWFDES